MAQRAKRSISLPPDLARAIDQAADAEDTTFSAWLANAAVHRLKVEAGRRGIEAWEHEHGPLSEAEQAEARSRVDALLGPGSAKKPARRPA